MESDGTEQKKSTDGHLFITVLAYQFVQFMRTQPVSFGVCRYLCLEGKGGHVHAIAPAKPPGHGQWRTKSAIMPPVFSGFADKPFAMKVLFDIFPVVLFFVAFKFGDIFIATGVAIAASFVQIGWLLARERKVDKMLWISLAIIVVTGGLTLLLHDETFIKWKPTVLYWAFAAGLGGSTLFFRKNLIRSLLAEQINAPDSVWRRINLSWIGFFVFMGFANLAVAFAFNLPTETWVNFKLFGGIGLMFVFALLQGWALSRYIDEKK
jgi:intracellular septation protein